MNRSLVRTRSSAERHRVVVLPSDGVPSTRACGCREGAAGLVLAFAVGLASVLLEGPTVADWPGAAGRVLLLTLVGACIGKLYGMRRARYRTSRNASSTLDH